MRATAIALAVALLFAASFGWADNVPDMKDGAVTIPWEDFKKILDQLQKPDQAVEPQPPVPYVLGRGTLEGSLADGTLELATKYPLTVLKDGWVLCPLVTAAAPLADILIDGKTAPVTDSGGKVSLVLKGPASHTLTMRFRATAPMRPGPASVHVPLPQAAGQALSMKVGPLLTGVTVDGATMSRKPDNIVNAILTGDDLTVRYTVATEQKQEVVEKLPAKVLVENSTLVSIDEGFVRAIVQLAYEVRHAPVSEFNLIIPEGFDVADCTGASLVGWKFDDEKRQLTATVGFEVEGAYNLTVVLEQSTKEESFAIALPGVQALEVERERGFFAVQVTGGVEVTPGKSIKGLQMVDAKELPSGLRSGATNPIVLSFKYLRHPFAADLNVVRHETQPVLGAAIDSANYVMQITEDGDCVTRAVYTVRNNKKQFLELVLPDNEKVALWSSFVAGKPVKPSKTKEGMILLPLEKSSYSGQDLSTFQVELIYYSNLGFSLDTVGTIDITMPEVDLPISRSMLTVFAPKRLRYLHAGGSLKEPYQPPSSFITGRPLSIGTSGRHQAPELNYQEYDGDYEFKTYHPSGNKTFIWGDGAEVPEPEPEDEELYSRVQKKVMPTVMDMQQAEAEQVFKSKIRTAQAAQDQTGALPARFAVPQEGYVQRYNELVTIGESSTLKLRYFPRKTESAVAILAFLLTAALAWFSTKLVAGGAGGRKLFVIVAVLVVLLATAGAPVRMVIWGAILGFAGRIVRRVAMRVTRRKQGF